MAEEQKTQTTPCTNPNRAQKREQELAQHDDLDLTAKAKEDLQVLEAKTLADLVVSEQQNQNQNLIRRSLIFDV
jgi:hypothetical protein